MVAKMAALASKQAKKLADADKIMSQQVIAQRPSFQASV